MFATCWLRPTNRPSPTPHLMNQTPVRRQSNARQAVCWLILMAIIHPAALVQANTEEDAQKALIIRDLSDCGHGEYVMFTVLWKGVVGVATEHYLWGWNKPRIGEQLSGPFLETGTTEATYLNKSETTQLDIIKTGIPIANQGALVTELCTERP